MSAMAQAQAKVSIAVHAGETTGRYHPDWNYFGADEPNYVYAPNGKKLLGELHDLSRGPVYFRPHNLLTTGDGEGSLKWGSTNVYTEKADGTPVYDWTITDRIFDAMRDAGVRPLVEVGFMPEALSTHPEPYRHDFPKGDVFTGWSYPPKDYGKWGKLVEAYAAHLKQRYGAATGGWLWEVWNEPDIAYWHGTPEEYDRLYDVTTAAIRRVLPAAKVGGPSATGISSDRAEHLLRQFLEHCESGKNAATGGVGAPLDFISYHPKGSPKFIAGTGEATAGHVEMNLGQQLRSTGRGMKIIASYPRWKSTPIILTETDPEGCAACKGPQNGYRNGPLYGVSVAEAMARIDQLGRKYGVNLQGGVTWAFEFEGQPWFAGFRDLATNGVDKPVLNVFRMYGKLGGDWVKTESSGALGLEEIVKEGVGAKTDVDAIATRSEHEVDVLLWNYSDVDLPAEPAEVEMAVDGLPNATIRMEELRMDSGHSNAYSVWLKMGSPQQPTPAQKAELVKASGLESMGGVKKVAAKEGRVTVPLSLPRQGVGLVRIWWEGAKTE
jgi:xylan 1,4-beta-xylosidase